MTFLTKRHLHRRTLLRGAGAAISLPLLDAMLPAASAAPAEVRRILDVPESWKLIAYLCLGYPVEEHTDPELERAGWQQRLDAGEFIHRR